MPSVSYRSLWEPLDRAELPVLEWVERTRFGGAIEHATRVISESGQHGLVWYAVAAAMAGRSEGEGRRRWIAAGAKVAGVYAANTALKVWAGRRRPPVASLGTPTDLSFPSSHAATSFAAARLYGDLMPGARPLFYAGALALTGSRLHFCVHYPTDLLAGAALGDAAARALS